MSKIFVRHRRHAGRGACRPRFAIVASHGVDLRVYRTRVRRGELEKIAAVVDAEIVYLPRGEEAQQPDSEGMSRRGGRRRRQETG